MSLGRRRRSRKVKGKKLEQAEDEAKYEDKN